MREQQLWSHHELLEKDCAASVCRAVGKRSCNGRQRAYLAYLALESREYVELSSSAHVLVPGARFAVPFGR